MTPPFAFDRPHVSRVDAVNSRLSSALNKRAKQYFDMTLHTHRNVI